MGDEAMVAEIRSWVQEAQDIAAQHPDEANPIMDALAGLIVRIDAAEAQLEQVQRERDNARYRARFTDQQLDYMRERLTRAERVVEAARRNMPPYGASSWQSEELISAVNDYYRATLTKAEGE